MQYGALTPARLVYSAVNTQRNFIQVKDTAPSAESLNNIPRPMKFVGDEIR